MKLKVNDIFIKPIVSVIGMSLAVFYTFNYLSGVFNSNTIATLISILAGAIVYGTILLCVGSIKVKDVLMIFNRK
ncbi:MAG: polysaccharide biosynthesis C-terminal domain-containing protein [Marinisporobacter sp.]|nr:polysaccharide biosynthesis C-terminal domain-containing protein [Marinisporobacter sp.]